MPRVLSVALVAGVTLIGLASLGAAGDGTGGSPPPQELHPFGGSPEAPGVSTGPTLQGADLQHTSGNQPSVTASNDGSFAINDPEFGLNWVLPAALIAGFAAGYGVRSLVSSQRHRRARRSRFCGLTSDRLQFEADNSHMSIVPPDDVGDLQSPQRPNRGAI